MLSFKKICSVAAVLLSMLCLGCFANAEGTDLGYIIKLSNQAVTLLDISGEYDPLASLGIMVVPDEETAKEMVENGFALAYEQNCPVELLSESWQPVDTAYSSQFAPEQMNAHVAWKIGYYGEDVTVAVVDTGVNSHIDLDDRIVHKYNYYTGTTDVTDEYGHGTHVAGSVAAEINGSGVVGIAPKCNLAIIKCFSKSQSNSVDVFLGSLKYAVDLEGVDIISISLGANLSGDNAEIQKEAFAQTMALAEQKGIVVCAAVGNKGNSTSALMYPAATEYVFGVGAVQSDGSHYSYSSVNESVDIVAGGASVYSCSYSGSDSYATKSGTSMACPAVSGAAAILLGADPTLTPAQIRNLICETATDSGDEGYDQTFGYGLVNVEKALKKLITQEVHVSDITEFTINGVTKEYYSVFNNSDTDFSVAAASYEDEIMASIALRDISAGETEKLSRAAGSGQCVKLMFFRDFLSFSPFRLPFVLG